MPASQPCRRECGFLSWSQSWWVCDEAQPCTLHRPILLNFILVRSLRNYKIIIAEVQHFDFFYKIYNCWSAKYLRTFSLFLSLQSSQKSKCESEISSDVIFIMVHWFIPHPVSRSEIITFLLSLGRLRVSASIGTIVQRWIEMPAHEQVSSQCIQCAHSLCFPHLITAWHRAEIISIGFIERIYRLV